MLGVIDNFSSFTRPANTTAYASGDLVANSTTAASVEPLSIYVGPEKKQSLYIRKARIKKSGTGVTNAEFRIHFYSSAPTSAAGDNAAYSTDNAANYLGAIDVTVNQAFTDGAVGSGTSNVGNEISFIADGETSTESYVYALVEARGAYTPASGETFTVTLEAHRY